MDKTTTSGVSGMMGLSAAGCLWPPVIWAVYFVGVYAWQGLACGTALNSAELAGVNLVRLGLILIWIVALGLMLITGLRAWRIGQVLSHDPENPSDKIAERMLFMRWLSLLLSGLFLVAVIWIGLPTLMLDPCTVRFPFP